MNFFVEDNIFVHIFVPSKTTADQLAVSKPDFYTSLKLLTVQITEWQINCQNLLPTDERKRRLAVCYKPHFKK